MLRLGGALLSALLVFVTPDALAASKSRSKSKSTRTRSGTSKVAPVTPEPQPAPAAEPASEKQEAKEAEAEAAPVVPVEQPRPVVAAKPAAVARPAPAPRATPAAARPSESSSKATAGRMRIGVGPDLFLESAKLNGEQFINISRRDESFDYSSAGFVSATLWLNTSVPSVSQRLRVGAGARIFGNYGAGGDRTFGFGLLNEAFAFAEYGLPVADKMEVVFAARGGISLLVPGQEFAEEIRRLQEQGVGVWSVPRVGWLVGPSVGARRRMTERILLRADILAQVQQQYLFATSEDIDGLRYTKNWSTLALRLGLSLGVEFDF
ncbi:hypothetical protein BON30_44245 [Cystobacter ferrugineus]|uniref:Outer membrane protein beta-barrel domain-containing protein n=2 Tax=Cystobacter ferrugineus TaxID=83449 RepID=A0A1L9AWD6_9BACT|nr:hypothetical protein BON30_44245 [Cystobacter ferrugineus]